MSLPGKDRALSATAEQVRFNLRCRDTLERNEEHFGKMWNSWNVQIKHERNLHDEYVAEMVAPGMLKRYLGIGRPGWRWGGEYSGSWNK